MISPEKLTSILCEDSARKEKNITIERTKTRLISQKKDSLSTRPTNKIIRIAGIPVK